MKPAATMPNPRGKASSSARKNTEPSSPPQGDVRRAVLDATLDIVATDGPDAVSMREVARRAGVSHQAPYHYFGDRAGIFTAIAEEGFSEFAKVLQASLTTTDPLASSLTTYVQFAFTHQGHFKVMFRSDLCGIQTCPDTKRAADAAFQALIDLARIVDTRPHDEGDDMQLPILLWSQAHGLATLLIDGPLRDKLPAELSVEHIVSFVSPIFSRSINAVIK